MKKCDFLVVGGGIIGLSIAREIKRRNQQASVVLIEKEAAVGLHASGRNSGVLHAGFYYTADSLKARFTRVGNARMLEYVERKNLRVNKCGKLVVAKNEREVATLDELLRRGRANGVVLDDITEADAREIEPRIRTCGRALYSPATASVDPTEVVTSMAADAVAEGIEIRADESYESTRDRTVRTSRELYSAGYVVNAAGLHADSVARDFGFSEKYRILPFRGLYLYSSEKAGSLRTNVYPVPDLRNPFLGVHFTLTVDGKAKIGPTAIPALWREQYGFLDNFRLNEFLDVARRGTALLLSSNFEFRTLAIEEFKKQSRLRLATLARELLTGVEPENFRVWGRPGIRAQLCDVTKRALVMDFLIEGDDRSLHVLNAVSPGFTCALPFADHVCDRIEALAQGKAAL